MCYRIHVLKSHWHRFCAEVIFFSLNSELNLLLHKAIQIKDQVETTTMSGGGRGENESRTRETSHGGVLWLSVSHPRLSQCSHTVTVIVRSLQQVGGPPPRYLAIRKFPICRESLWYVWVWLLCCLPSPAPPQPRPRARNLKPFPGRRRPPQAPPLTGCQERKPDQERAGLRGAAVDWVLKVTTAIQRDGGRVTLTKDLTFKAGTLKLKWQLPRPVAFTQPWKLHVKRR